MAKEEGMEGPMRNLLAVPGNRRGLEPILKNFYANFCSCYFLMFVLSCCKSPLFSTLPAEEESEPSLQVPSGGY